MTNIELNHSLHSQGMMFVIFSKYKQMTEYKIQHYPVE